MIIFNEIQYAENIIRNGCSKKFILVDFKILAKYFLYYKKYNEIDTRNEMLRILKNNQDIIPINFLPSKISTAIKYAKTENLKNLKQVEIKQNEIDYINKLPEELRELAFIYLFLWKWNNSEDGFFIDKSDLKKLLKKPSLSNLKINLMDGELERINYVKFIDFCRKEKIKVNIPNEDSCVIINVEDFDNVLLYYKKLCGAKIKKCIDCGCLIEIKSNSQKYCKCCAKRHKLEKVRELKKSQRENGME